MQCRWMDKPKAICPINFFKAADIIKSDQQGKARFFLLVDLRTLLL